MAKRPEDLVKGVIKLISLPEIFIRVNQVMEELSVGLLSQ